MITYNLFITLILFSTLIPIVGAMTLLFTLAFEREMDVLKIENNRVLLEKELQHSEYMQLNQQIQPHFLFNSMNLLLGLARLGRIDELIQIIEHLSHYLKFKYRVTQQLIPFSLELNYSKSYLAIQKVRFSDRLSVEIDVTGEHAETALVPPYLLQTLVENAFKHGLEKKIGPIHLFINFHQSDSQSHLKVVDNGVGLKKTPFKLTESNGHGLRNIDKRLSLLFPNHYQLNIANSASGGTVVDVFWPFIEEEVREHERVNGG